MADNVAFQTTNTESLDTAQVADIQPNFNAIQANFEALQAAFNQLNSEVGTGTGVNLQAVNVLFNNQNPVPGLLSDLPLTSNVAAALVDLSSKTQANNYLVDKTLFNNTFADFTGTTVQELFDFCDGNLQPLITETPSITGLTFNFPLVQPNGWNLFDDLDNNGRTFNADITVPGNFTRIELRANGTEIATYTTLARSVRSQLIPFIQGQQDDWDTAVAAGGTDGSGRTIVNMVLEGFQSAGANVVSNTVQILIGAAAQPEIVYWESNGVAANLGQTGSAALFNQVMALGNPATINITIPVDIGFTENLYFSFLIPARYDSYQIQQVTPLGNIDARSYFSDFSTPFSRTINGEMYNVISSVALVPNFTAQFRLVLSDTS